MKRTAAEKKSIQGPAAAYRRGWIWAYIHFAAEVLCFTFMYRRFGGRGAAAWWLAAIVYDALAFVPQSFLGILTDRRPEIRYGALGGILLVLGFLIPANVPAMLLLCTGNCLVHLSGARATVIDTEGRLGPGGIFVGGGSFGVITGRLLGEYLQKTASAPAGGLPRAAAAALPVILALIAVILMLRQPPERIHTAADFRLDRPVGSGLLVLLVSVTVAARAYVGYAIPTGWNKTAGQTVLLFCCMGAGKALGGVLADRFGARRIAVGGLLLSIPFLVMGDSRMLLSLIGVGLFSLTMPVSLGVLLSRFPDMPGLCFGITTAGLFAGSAPAFFVKPLTLSGNIAVVCVLTVAAAGAFLGSMRPDRKGAEDAA